MNMKIHNCADCAAYVAVGNDSFMLTPGESAIYDYDGTITIELRHDYGSTAMPEKEMAEYFSPDSVIRLCFLSCRDPFFQLVLDSEYEISGAEIEIRKEVIRPIDTCSYDRLYPLVRDGTVKELSYVIPEERAFKQLYLNAVCRSNRDIHAMHLIVISGLLLPISLFGFLIDQMIGLICLVGVVVVVAVAYFLGKLFSRQRSKADCSSFYANFRSGRIIRYFKERAE